MADGAHTAIASKTVTLPFRVQQAPAARRRSSLYLIVGITAVCAFVAVVVYSVAAYALFENTLGPAILAGLAMLFMAWRSFRWVNRPSKVGLPLCSFQVSAAQISCNDLIEGAFAWAALTPFRWGLQTPDQPDANKGFVIEAAETSKADQSNAAGFYDQPAIQFDLDDLCLTQPSRADADAVTALLNRLQAAAAAGTLRDGETIEVPAFLNTLPAPHGS
jgi:hypothetical protein